MAQFINSFFAYNPTTFAVQNDYIRAMTTRAVLQTYSHQYAGDQAVTEQLKNKGTRTVDVLDVNLVNNHRTHPSNPNDTAIVTFKTTDQLFSGQVLDTRLNRAILTFTYTGTPTRQVQQFINYDGFTVTGLQVFQLQGYQGD